MTKKVFEYESWGATISFAAGLGFDEDAEERLHAEIYIEDYTDDRWDDLQDWQRCEILDEMEGAAVEYIRSSGYTVIGWE